MPISEEKKKEIFEKLKTQLETITAEELEEMYNAYCDKHNISKEDRYVQVQDKPNIVDMWDFLHSIGESYFDEDIIINRKSYSGKLDSEKLNHEVDVFGYWSDSAVAKDMRIALGGRLLKDNNYKVLGTLIIVNTLNNQRINNQAKEILMRAGIDALEEIEIREKDGK